MIGDDSRTSLVFRCNFFYIRIRKSLDGQCATFLAVYESLSAKEVEFYTEQEKDVYLIVLMKF